MPKNIRRGPIPDDLGWLIDELDDHAQRIGKLEGPSGEALAQTVRNLTVLVEDLQSYLDDYIANDLPALVDAAVAAALAGNVSIGGTLTVAGAVRFPNVPATTFVAEPRTVVWVDTSNGRLGRT